jgi:hypothetical protein
MEYAAMLAYNEAWGRVEPSSAMVLARSAGRAPETASASFIGQQLRDQARDERRVALRKGQSDVPWLSGIKVSWGAELQLINISSSGVLVETGSKFAPGSTTDLHLTGPDTNLVVPVRFIRSDVARIDGLGVRYRAAAAFTTELDLANPRRDAPVASTPPGELAALFAAVLAKKDTLNEPAHVQFAKGLRRLVGARDVQVRTGSIGSAGGQETLYFDVPGDDRSRTTLQVVFDRHQDVTDAQFRLLKAAAWITAAVLELERPAVAPAERPAGIALLSERVA